jgi:hypothetical protein
VAQIFISHSAKDSKPVEFLNRAFASSNVQAKYEEIEAIISGRRTEAQIRADVAQSNAVMIVLGRNAETLKHTRDWINWESGNAAALNKDIWVLEAFEDSPHLSVVIPCLRHYVSFHYTDLWLAHLREIVVSYDDSHVAKAALVGAGLGGAIGEGFGALVGGIAGLLLANVQSKPPSSQGFPLTCLGCRSTYNVHVGVPTLRCPVCNARLQFSTNVQAAAAVSGQ